MMAKDTTFLNDNLDESLIYIHSNGLRESKSDFIYSISKGKIVYLSFKFIERKRVNAETSRPIFRGQIIVEGTYEGQPFQVKLAFVSAYVKKNKRFQLVYWQSTKL